MAKGFKLKQLLAHQKEAEKYEQAKKGKAAPVLKEDEPTVVTSEDLVSKSIKERKEVPHENNNNSEEYQSQALSKKEKRLLKKQLKKVQQADETEVKPRQEEAVVEGLEPEELEVEEEEEEDVEGEQLDLDRLARSDSDSDDEDEDEEEKEDADKDEQEQEYESKSEEEEADVPLSDVEFDSDADVVPHHKLTINNTKAMKHSLERIQLPWNKHSFQEHQSVTSKTDTDEGIKDIYDDTERELAFYKQSLDAVLEARQQFKRLKVPFKRPLDYFAEMAKNDEHMDKIKGKLVHEASEKKAREDSRKQRDLKKFGKQVQVATLQKRQLEKRDTLEKIKSLKKKRKHSEIGDSDFAVGIEEAASEEKGNKPNFKRSAKNSKYGQGGMKRFKRKNDAESSADVTGFSQRKMKGKTARPGKSKRSRRH